MAKKFLILILMISCGSSVETNLLEVSTNNATKIDPVEETLSLSSEEILVEIFDAYKDFTDNPVATVDIIWNYAHEKNRDMTGPKERFSMMLTSEPYNSIIDLKDYSYEIIIESDESIHYEVKVLAKNNNYFVITWVFEKTLCEKNSCWRTIGVSQPKYFDSGI